MSTNPKMLTTDQPSAQPSCYQYLLRRYLNCMNTHCDSNDDEAKCCAGCTLLWTSITILTIAVLIGLLCAIFIPLHNADIRRWQESKIIDLSQSTIIKIERDHNTGLILTNNGQVWLVNRDYVCQLNVPNSIDIHQNFILTTEKSIIGIDTIDFSNAIDSFTAYGSTIQSLQLAKIFNRCELVRIGEPMMLTEYNDQFNSIMVLRT